MKRREGNMEKLIEKVKAAGVVPVVKIDDAKDAVDLAKALRNGGLNCAEITFRTNAAEEAIKRIRAQFPDMLIAAGTVLSAEQADRAMAAGADFIVSPGLNPEVVRHCMVKGYLIVPGVCTPGEVEKALCFGLKYLKFFPAEAAGGVKMIKAMAAPYVGVTFMPTGGINEGNLKDYLGCKAVFACGGSWMVPSDKIANGEFDEIEKLTAGAAALLKEIRK